MHVMFMQISQRISIVTNGVLNTNGELCCECEMKVLYCENFCDYSMKNG